MDTIYEVPTPKTPTKEGARDNRLRVQTLYFHANFTPVEIALQLNLTIDQVKYAIRHRVTPQKQRSGRHPLLGPAERKRLIEWVCASKKNRRAPWNQIPAILGWDCKVYAIETAFKKEDFGRYTALRKPKLTEKHAKIRLEWAEEHKNWTEEQWFRVFWTDETWVKPGRHRKVKVTRKKGEALHPDCVEPKIQRHISWMFWGGISGLYGKGPGLFWEKKWGTIKSQSYCEHIVPLIERYTLPRGLILMQDNARGHSAQNTEDFMRRRGLIPIFWLGLSPDLNPIKTLWNRIKDIIEEQHPNGGFNSVSSISRQSAIV
jgi:hypothetical protein